MDGMTEILDEIKAYVCHARPPILNGKECRHNNLGGGKPKYRRGDDGASWMMCCEKCGCTKKASDDRLREAKCEKS